MQYKTDVLFVVLHFSYEQTHKCIYNNAIHAFVRYIDY